MREVTNHQVDRCVSASTQEKEADEPLQAGGTAGEKSRFDIFDPCAIISARTC